MNMSNNVRFNTKGNEMTNTVAMIKEMIILYNNNAVRPVGQIYVSTDMWSEILQILLTEHITFRTLDNRMILHGLPVVRVAGCRYIGFNEGKV